MERSEMMHRCARRALVAACCCFSTKAQAQIGSAFLDRSSNITVTIGADCATGGERCTITGNEPLKLTVKREDHGTFCTKVTWAKVLLEAVPQAIQSDNTGREFGGAYNQF